MLRVRLLLQRDFIDGSSAQNCVTVTDIFAKRTIPSGSAQLTYTSVQCVLLRESHIRKITGMSDQKLEDLTCFIDNFKAEIRSELVELNKRLLTVETQDLREKRQV